MARAIPARVVGLACVMLKRNSNPRLALILCLLSWERLRAIGVGVLARRDLRMG
jgi:hypothetical protein